MHLVNLVYSLQALDSALAIGSQLASEGSARRITTLLHLSDSMLVPNADFLFELVGTISDEIVILGDGQLHAHAERVLRSKDRAYDKISLGERTTLQRGINSLRRRLRIFPSRARTDSLEQYLSPECVLLKSHADVDDVAQALVRGVRGLNGRVFVCLEGTYPPGQSIPVKYFVNPRIDLADRFLLYHESHADPLRSVGYNNFFTIGCPMLYPSWQSAVSSSNAFRESNAAEGRPKVSVLCRGEQPGAKHQLISNATLARILADIFDEFAEWNEHAHIRLKPHPLQDVEFLRQQIQGRPNVEISSDHPSLLAATSDYVVTTWSTTAIDALAWRVPCIEYFIENDYFRSVYPDGSSFRKLGILWAEDRAGFRRCLQQLGDGSYQIPDPAEVLGHRMDLTVFTNDRAAPPPGCSAQSA